MERRYRRRRKPGQQEFYVYRPRGDLLQRLSDELKMSYPDVMKQVRRERVLILRSLGYEVGDNEMV